MFNRNNTGPWDGSNRAASNDPNLFNRDFSNPNFAYQPQTAYTYPNLQQQINPQNIFPSPNTVFASQQNTSQQNWHPTPPQIQNRFAEENRIAYQAHNPVYTYPSQSFLTPHPFLSHESYQPPFTSFMSETSGEASDAELSQLLQQEIQQASTQTTFVPKEKNPLSLETWLKQLSGQNPEKIYKDIQENHYFFIKNIEQIPITDLKKILQITYQHNYPLFRQSIRTINDEVLLNDLRADISDFNIFSDNVTKKYNKHFEKRISELRSPERPNKEPFTPKLQQLKKLLALPTKTTAFSDHWNMLNTNPNINLNTLIPLLSDNEKFKLFVKMNATQIEKFISFLRNVNAIESLINFIDNNISSGYTHRKNMVLPRLREQIKVISNGGKWQNVEFPIASRSHLTSTSASASVVPIIVITDETVTPPTNAPRATLQQASMQTNNTSKDKQLSLETWLDQITNLFGHEIYENIQANHDFFIKNIEQIPIDTLKNILQIIYKRNYPYFIQIITTINNDALLNNLKIDISGLSSFMATAMQKYNKHIEEKISDLNTPEPLRQLKKLLSFRANDTVLFSDHWNMLNMNIDLKTIIPLLTDEEKHRILLKMNKQQKEKFISFLLNINNLKSLVKFIKNDMSGYESKKRPLLTSLQKQIDMLLQQNTVSGTHTSAENTQQSQKLRTPITEASTENTYSIYDILNTTNEMDDTYDATTLEEFFLDSHEIEHLNQTSQDSKENDENEDLNMILSENLSMHQNPFTLLSNPTNNKNETNKHSQKRTIDAAHKSDANPDDAPKGPENKKRKR